MCLIEAYNRLHPTYNDNTIIGVVRPTYVRSTSDALTSLFHTLKFIDRCLNHQKIVYLVKHCVYRDN